jgi:hypothetical protein
MREVLLGALAALLLVGGYVAGRGSVLCNSKGGPNDAVALLH